MPASPHPSSFLRGGATLPGFASESRLNTHTDISTTGRIMTQIRERARQVIGFQARHSWRTPEDER
jgi:hypothetical protein